tara:strand:+ start:454 stop:1062 length:609 start_codon:yes stop_codon:yes gene_type:complete
LQKAQSKILYLQYSFYFYIYSLTNDFKFIKIKEGTTNILINLFLFNKKTEKNEDFSQGVVDQYREIARIVKEARKQQNLTIQELSYISKIPEKTLNSLENNNKNIRPKYPFIRSILIKLEECLVLKKNTLLKLSLRERETFKKEKKEFLISKLDIINTWKGSLLYFFILVLTLFIFKRYFVSNFKVIEIQDIDNKSLINNLQ